MHPDELKKYQDIKNAIDAGCETNYGRNNNARKHYKFLKKVLKSRKQMVVADLGCGYGVFCRWIKTLFPQHIVYGVDPVFVPENDENLPKSYIGFMKGDSTRIPLPRVDLLTSFDVMEHVHPDDLNKSLREIARVTDWYIAGIAVGSDKDKVTGKDVELHAIQKPLSWWCAQFRKHFDSVEITDGLVVCKKGKALEIQDKVQTEHVTGESKASDNACCKLICHCDSPYSDCDCNFKKDEEERL
jgi:SAM-dependent methyltransferase